MNANSVRLDTDLFPLLFYYIKTRVVNECSVSLFAYLLTFCRAIFNLMS